MGKHLFLLFVYVYLLVFLVDQVHYVLRSLLSEVYEVLLVGILLVSPLVLVEHTQQVNYVLVLLMGHSRFYLVQLHITLEQVLVVFTVIDWLVVGFHGIDAPFEVSFEGDSQDIVETIDIFLIIIILPLSPYIGNPVELISNLGRSPVGHEVIFITIKINAHEIHFKHITNKFFLGAHPIKEHRLVI